MSKQQLEQSLKALSDAYAKKLPREMETLADNWEEFLRGEEEAVLDAFRRSVHKLSGSAGLYGFHEISECAAGLDMYLKELKQQNKLPDAEARIFIKKHLEKFRHCVMRLHGGT